MPDTPAPALKAKLPARKPSLSPGLTTTSPVTPVKLEPVDKLNLPLLPVPLA
jgi:hypothetical protein